MSTSMMDRESAEAARVFADPTAYADDERLHKALAHLRAHQPVPYVDHPPYRPFYAITSTPT